MKRQAVHFVGIGGIGMSGVARIMKSRGSRVTGSDIRESSVIRLLRKEGIKCFVGHSRENVPDCQTVVYSSSISRNNPELEAAGERGIALKHRSKALAELTTGKNCIAVTGAHGKTTTTALLAHVYRELGRDPEAAVGGEVINFGSNVLCGKGRDFILEADESDGSFLNYSPQFAILLNADREHTDYFKDLRMTLRLYKQFVKRTSPGGTVFFNYDDPSLRSLMASFKGRKLSFGRAQGADVRAGRIRQEGLKVIFECRLRQSQSLIEVELPMPGSHNVYNALAVIAVCNESGAAVRAAADSFASYKGTKRRFEIKETKNGFTLIEDYAHHPKEIEAVLKACEGLGRRLVVVFQPHRYSRTRDLLPGFVRSFDLSSHLILTDIYAASEKPIEGVSSALIFDGIKRRGRQNVEYIAKDRVPERLNAIVKREDIVLILGAGDINEISAEFVSPEQKIR